MTRAGQRRPAASWPCSEQASSPSLGRRQPAGREACRPSTHCTCHGVELVQAWCRALTGVDGRRPCAVLASDGKPTHPRGWSRACCLSSRSDRGAQLVEGCGAVPVSRRAACGLRSARARKRRVTSPLVRVTSPLSESRPLVRVTSPLVRVLAAGAAARRGQSQRHPVAVAQHSHTRHHEAET